MFVAEFNNQCSISRSTIKKNQGISVLLLLGLTLSSFSVSCLADNSLQTSINPNARVKLLETDSSPKLQNTIWWTIARHRHIDPYILYAVALVESANSDDHITITPWPWAINKAGKAIISNSKKEAQRILNKTVVEGNRNIDVGMMQVNLYWHGHRVDKPEQLLNPVTNLEIGANVLAEAIQSSPNNLELGIGRYHSWQNSQAAVLYGQRVLAVANQIRVLI